MILIFFLVLIIWGLFLIENHSWFLYVIGLTIFFNIGGYINSDALGFPGYFTAHDAGLIIAFIGGLWKSDLSILKKDRDLRRLLFIIFLFIFYQIFISLIYNLNLNTPYKIGYHIFIHKWRIFGVLFIIPTYFMINNYAREIFYMMVLISAIVISLYYISLFLPINLIAINTLEREIGQTAAQRMWFPNPGYVTIFIPIAFFILLNKIDIKYKKVIVFIGVGMLISTLLTLTRGSIIFMFGSLLITIIISVKKLDLKLPDISFKVYFIIFSSLILFFIIFHSHLIKLYETFRITLLEFIGKVPMGTTQTRTEFEIPKMLGLISNNKWLGTGFLHDYFWSYHTEYEIGLADVTVLGHIALYGILGFAIFLVRYLYIHSKIKKIDFNEILNNNLYQFLFLLYGSITFYSYIFFRFHSFSAEILNAPYIISGAFVIGCIYSIRNKINYE